MQTVTFIVLKMYLQTNVVLLAALYVDISKYKVKQITVNLEKLYVRSDDATQKIHHHIMITVCA